MYTHIDLDTNIYKTIVLRISEVNGLKRTRIFIADFWCDICLKVNSDVFPYFLHADRGG